MKKYLLILAAVAPLLLLPACGGDNSSLPAAPNPTSNVTTGIAVDPYLVGAVFQEIDGGGMVLQAGSGPSDTQGRFVFPQPLTAGSTIQLVMNQRGSHAGIPYTGMLRRTIVAGDADPVVVSPMTTLVANGMTPEEVVLALESAGLTGLSPEDVFADPLAGITLQGAALSDPQLKGLQASLAINTFLEVTGNFAAGSEDLSTADNALVLQALVTSVTSLLNATEFQSVRDALGTPVTVEDLLAAVVSECQTLAAQTSANLASHGGALDQATMDGAIQTALNSLDQMVQEKYQQRTGDMGGGMPPVMVDGQALYAANCAACHKLGTYDPTGDSPELGGQGNLIVATLTSGHQGFNLAADEINALADWADANPAPVVPPGPDPTPAPSGEAIFLGRCASCHNVSGNGGTSDLSGNGALLDTKFGGGARHFGNTLSAEEIANLANYLNSF